MWKFLSGVAAVLALAQTADAQEATLHVYDALGRVVVSGRNDSSTNLYEYDKAGNRRMVRCCMAVGGQQVLDDGFDPYFYLTTYADIRAANMDPYQHWLQYGASEGRWPNRYFNTGWYRSAYAIPANVNPLTDYHSGGWQAGRNPSASFSTAAYHNAYGDTVAIDPLQHYLRWGYGEGRSAFPVQ